MNDPKSKDLEIWRKLKNGDQEAFEHIYRFHIDALIQYGCRFSSDANLVEDSLHDLFTDLWKNRSSIGDTDSIRRYLMVSLRRRIVRNLARNKASHFTSLSETRHFEAELVIDQKIIDTEKDREWRNKINRAFSKLTDRQREVLYLKFYQNLDYDDICEIMEINYQSARNLIFRSIQTLRDIITSK